MSVGIGGQSDWAEKLLLAASKRAGVTVSCKGRSSFFCLIRVSTGVNTHKARCLDAPLEKSKGKRQ
jgi:hypothetical protein